MLIKFYKAEYGNGLKEGGREGGERMLMRQTNTEI
jgi:hypothetical protein